MYKIFKISFLFIILFDCFNLEYINEVNKLIIIYYILLSLILVELLTERYNIGKKGITRQNVNITRSPISLILINSKPNNDNIPSIMRIKYNDKYKEKLKSLYAM